SEYSGWIIATLLVVAIESWVIAVLFWQKRRLRRVERTLRENEESMALASEAAALGMVMWNIDEEKIWTSEEWRQIHGYRGDEEISFQDFIRRVHPEDRSEVQGALRSALETKGRFHLQHRLLLP